MHLWVLADLWFVHLLIAVAPGPRSMFLAWAAPSSPCTPVSFGYLPHQLMTRLALTRSDKLTIQFNISLDICRNTAGAVLFKTSTVKVPSVKSFYDIPYSLDLPEVENFFKSPATASTTGEYTFKYLNVSPVWLPCWRQTLVIREEYQIVERLLTQWLETRYPEQPPDCAVTGSPGIGMLFR